MDFKMAMNYIEEKNKLGIVPGLDNIKELLLRLGNPQNEIKCLHVAGTNGKGSIFSFMEDILLEAGYRVGRYISPTIFTYLERFQINKNMMTEGDFAEYVEKLSVIIESMEQEGFNSPTAFEIETAIAFLYYRDMQVDFALVECGMGGTLDATNVIDNTVAEVMASISRDHMQFLGETLSEIAGNKAGIIKKDSICVSYPQEQEVYEVLKATCDEKNTSFTIINKHDIKTISEELNGTEFLYKGGSYKISLLGGYQVYNACVAIELTYQLVNRNIIDTDYEKIKIAIADTKWPGRFTKVHDKPMIFVDGAHNEKAWLWLRETVNKYFTNKRIIYIIGVLKDKEYDRMLDILSDTMKMAVTVTPPTPRGLKKEQLKELLEARNVYTETADNSKEAISKALAKAKMDDVVLVCGSLSFIADYLV